MQGRRLSPSTSMVQVDAGRSPASCSPEDGTPTTGPGTGTPVQVPGKANTLNPGWRWPFWGPQGPRGLQAGPRGDLAKIRDLAPLTPSALPLPCPALDA